MDMQNGGHVTENYMEIWKPIKGGVDLMLFKMEKIRGLKVVALKGADPFFKGK